MRTMLIGTVFRIGQSQGVDKRCNPVYNVDNLTFFRITYPGGYPGMNGRGSKLAYGPVDTEACNRTAVLP